MPKSFFTSIVFCLLMFPEGFAQPSAQASVTTYTYHPPSQDKLSWQRLNLYTSATFYRGMRQSSISMDSSLLAVSKSLGLSRLPFAAEGIDNPQLLAQSKWFDERNPGEGVRMLSNATGMKRLELMILLGAYYVFQPDNYKLYKDSVERYLNKAVVESKTMDERLGRVALCLLAKMYGQARDTTKADAVFNQVIGECEKAGDKRTGARAFAYRGMFTPYSPTLIINRCAYYKKAAEIYRELNDVEGEICVTTSLALLYLATSHLDDAYQYFLKAFELQESIGYPYTHYNTDHLASVTMFQGKFGEPLKYALQTVKTAEVTRDSIGFANFYLRLGQLYSYLDSRVDESLKWMLKSLDLSVKAKEKKVFIDLVNVVAVMNAKKGREKEALDLVLDVSKKIPPTTDEDRLILNIALTGCYIKLGQYKLAEQYATSADSIQTVSPAIPPFSRAYTQTQINNLFTAIHMAKGEFAAAKKYLDAYLADSSRVSVLQDKLTAYKRLITIDSAFNDASSAAKHYEQYTLLLDSSFRVSRTRQAEELEINYATQEKENQIISLNEQAKLKQASLKQAMLVKNLTIAGIIAVLIIAALLYRQNRLKQKNNTIITHKNHQLEHLLTEKEWLLKEIHHRVKNNLQIVMSLLNSQSVYIDNDAALTAIHDSQHRVHAMSLIHQKLYSSENVSSIDISLYIRELVFYLADSFNVLQRIRFGYAIEPLELDVSQAVPLGLILNEAITNSIKYAFPDNRNGTVSISLSKTAPAHYLLTISDNGIGIPADFKKTGSLGMSLMKGLSEDIDGSFSIDNNNGTTIKISFVHDGGIKNRNPVVASLISNN